MLFCTASDKIQHLCGKGCSLEITVSWLQKERSERRRGSGEVPGSPNGENRVVAVTAVPHNIWSHGGMRAGGVGRKGKERKRRKKKKWKLARHKNLCPLNKYQSKHENPS